MTHYEYLEQVAKSLSMGIDVPPFPVYPAFHMEWQGYVVPKQRPRGTASGKHYTPKETRVFEQKIREAAIARMLVLGIKRFECPVAVHLEVRDQIHSRTEQWMRKLMTRGLVVEPTGGDLDNKEKAILDALNCVVFKDDKQVVQVYKFRRYAETAGFKLHISAAGLTKMDLFNIEKAYKTFQRQGDGSQT